MAGLHTWAWPTAIGELESKHLRLCGLVTTSWHDSPWMMCELVAEAISTTPRLREGWVCWPLCGHTAFLAKQTQLDSRSLGPSRLVCGWSAPERGHSCQGHLGVSCPALSQTPRWLEPPVLRARWSSVSALGRWTRQNAVWAGACPGQTASCQTQTQKSDPVSQGLSFHLREVRTSAQLHSHEHVTRAPGNSAACVVSATQPSTAGEK